MKKSMILILWLVAECFGYSEAALKVFNTPLPQTQQQQERCWVICKKKLSKVEKLQEALEFYKNSGYYQFSSVKKRSR